MESDRNHSHITDKNSLEQPNSVASPSPEKAARAQPHHPQHNIHSQQQQQEYGEDKSREVVKGGTEVLSRLQIAQHHQPLQNVGFHAGHASLMPEFFDPRLPRASEDSSSLRGQRGLGDQGAATLGGSVKLSAVGEERYQMMLEREARWAEVRKYSDYIRRFAVESQHIEITKENYYDLYNMAVCLLKSVDSLDPDKVHSVQRKAPPPPEFDLSGQLTTTPSHQYVTSHSLGMQQSEFELTQARKSFDYYYNRGSLDGSFLPKYEAPLFYNNQPVSATFLNTVLPPYQSVPKAADSKQAANPKNFSGEVVFDDGSQDDPSRRPKRQRKRRSVYTSSRNLHCHMCGVTETPEWRRGPAGDHTLCNACGLHYAKSLKKQRKEREGRKHSIEMLLNQQQQQGAAAAASAAAASNPATETTSAPPS